MKLLPEQVQLLTLYWTHYLKQEGSLKTSQLIKYLYELNLMFEIQTIIIGFLRHCDIDIEILAFVNNLGY